MALTIVAGCGSSGGGNPTPDPFLLGDIDAGVGGFTINGVTGDRFIGESLGGNGDINGDGLGDVVISSANTPGAAFVVFGKADTTPIATSDLNGLSGGFTILSGGQDAELYQCAIAGDVNGDGLDDIVVGTSLADISGVNSAGAAYVIFGKTTTTPVDVADVAAGVGGFMIYGTEEFGDVGWSVDGAGDVNGDGLDDVLVSTRGINPAPHGCYVVFGKTTTEPISAPDLAAGIGGFAILGPTLSHAGLGTDVSGAGDVNGDGLDDILLGDTNYNVHGENQAGAVLVVFGKTTTELVSADDVYAGTGGFAILGSSEFQNAGAWVSEAGDVNGDGLDDVLLGASYYETIGTSTLLFPGAAYVVFGKASTEPVSLGDVEDGEFGIHITGSAGTHNLAVVGAAGDVNNDGLDDIIVAASNQHLMDGVGVGVAYIIYGMSLPGVVDVRDVAARAGGYAFAAPEGIDACGGSLSGAGDVNGDGTPDMVLRAHDLGSVPGTIYVVFLPEDAMP